jgi:hypothetical protein
MVPARPLHDHFDGFGLQGRVMERRLGRCAR